MRPEELLENYLAGVELLRKTVRGMSRADAIARPVAGKWSTLEVVSHLADFEPIFAERIKRILAMDRPLLMAADEGPFAQQLNYHHRELSEEMELIALTRQQLARVLRNHPAESYGRQGVHSHAGLVTIEQLLVQATRHIPHHVPFIEDKKKALGLSV